MTIWPFSIFRQPDPYNTGLFWRNKLQLVVSHAPALVRCLCSNILEMCFVQILDEMLDNGFPLATEINVLQDLVKPPTLLRKIKGAFLADSQMWVDGTQLTASLIALAGHLPCRKAKHCFGPFFWIFFLFVLKLSALIALTFQLWSDWLQVEIQSHWNLYRCSCSMHSNR